MCRQLALKYFMKSFQSCFATTNICDDSSLGLELPAYALPRCNLYRSRNKLKLTLQIQNRLCDQDCRLKADKQKTRRSTSSGDVGLCYLQSLGPLEFECLI